MSLGVKELRVKGRERGVEDEEPVGPRAGLQASTGSNGHVSPLGRAWASGFGILEWHI